jgi:glycosyltransferase involved in cell wall biosynthesis
VLFSPLGSIDKSRRILQVMYGWAESGGGTILPRSIAKELISRGHDVMVFYAGVKPMPGMPAYHVHDHEEDGVKLRGIFNRPHVFQDLENPHREIADPAILEAFRKTLDEYQPEVVHVHNLHNLSAALAGEIGRRNLPGYFTPHNYWLVCPRLYLFKNDLSLCEGPGTGAACGECVGHRENSEAYSDRRAQVRNLFIESRMTCLAVSGAVRDVLVGNGFPKSKVKVFYQGHKQADRIWEEVGSRRKPATPRAGVVFSFIGSALPHKGVQVLVKAAQELTGSFEVRIHGDSMPQIEQALKNLDTRGVVKFMGPYEYEDMPGILWSTDVAVIPSIWYDNAPLAVNECLAARVPVLGSDMGGIPEFLEPGKTGDVFRGRDPRDLARKMQNIIDDPAIVEKWQTQITRPPSFSEYISGLERLYAGEGMESANYERRTTVNWEGTQLAFHSLAHVNRRVCTELLAKSDIDISIEPYEPAQFIPEGNPQLQAIVAAHRRAKAGPAKVHVRHMWPPDFNPPPGGAWAMIQPWEFGSIPREWVVPIRESVDELWVPSTWSKSVYVKAGIPAERIAVIPNGVDPGTYRPDGHRYPLATRKRFKFLFVGGTVLRKGIDVAVHAFAAAFKAEDDVCLVIKASGVGVFYKDSDINSQLERVRDLPDSPEIEMITDNLADAEIAALYRACDALVMPYRAEGFCMPIAEAMASGLPVIATGHGACLDYCDEETTYFIPAEIRVMQVSYLPPPVDAYTSAEPDVVGLARLMKHVISHPEEVRAKAAKGRERILASYTWSHIGDQYAERIRELATRIPRRYAKGYLDPARFGPDVPPLEADGLRGCNFLLRPDWTSDRWVAVLKSYLGAFEPKDDVALVLRAEPGDNVTEERLVDAITALGRNPEAIPDVVLIDHALPESRVGGLYTACQAYVEIGRSSHRREAEACGLQILEDPTADSFRSLLMDGQKQHQLASQVAELVGPGQKDLGLEAGDDQHVGQFPAEVRVDQAAAG